MEYFTVERLPDRLITDIVKANFGLTLPDLPLPVDFESYSKQIIAKARQMSGVKSNVVDRLLNQKEGTEKARRY